MKKLITIFAKLILLSLVAMFTIQGCKKENELVNNPAKVSAKPHLREGGGMYYDSPMQVYDSAGAYDAMTEAVADLRYRDSITSYVFFADSSTNHWTSAVRSQSLRDTYDAANYYHTQRLSDINANRELREFTSLQSIADELNSMMVIDSAAANSMYSGYDKVINKTYYGFEPITDPMTSQLLNTDGWVQIDDNIYKFEKYKIKIITNGNEDMISYLDTATVSNSGYHVVVKSNTFRQGAPSGNQNKRDACGICNTFSSNNSSNFYIVSWSINMPNIIAGYSEAYLTLASWVKAPSGSYVLFPSTSGHVTSASTFIDAASCDVSSPYDDEHDNFAFMNNYSSASVFQLSTSPTSQQFYFNAHIFNFQLDAVGYLTVPGWGVTLSNSESSQTHTWTADCQGF